MGFKSFMDTQAFINEAKQLGFMVSERAGWVRLAGLSNAADHGQLSGSHATVTLGPATSRSTVTRTAAGAILAGPAGAIVGAVAKKDTSAVHVEISTPDGKVYTASHPAKEEARARRFADKFNERYAAEVPA